MTFDPNPWEMLVPYIKAMSPAQLKRLGELVSQPIIEPPRDPYLLEHFWPVKYEEGVQ